jgi:orotidine-5'-phosphate decarboxylase
VFKKVGGTAANGHARFCTMPCELILALDVETRAEAIRTLEPLKEWLRWVKIGLQLFTAHGPDLVREVGGMGFQIFLDLKLHDIPNTVAKSVASIAPLPVGMLTIHTSGGREMMAWARKAQADHAPDLLLLGVTVLTSLDTAAINETGVPASAGDQVARLATLAVGSGMRGLVCSPQEIAALRGVLPPGIKLVTPGIRPAGASADEQKRVMTPAEAAAAGADYIVVGRPILKAPDPAAAVAAILSELKC